MLAAFLAAALLILSSGVGCTPRQDAVRPPSTEPLTRARVKIATITDPFTPTNPFNRPAIGTRLVAVRVTIENSSAEELVVEPARWIKVLTRQGAVIDAATMVGEPDDISAGGSSLGRLAPAQQLDGLLFFEIPTGDDMKALRWHDDLQPPQSSDIPL